MLHEFLLKERENILVLCAKKLSGVIDTRSSSDEIDGGLSVFFDEIVEVLRKDEEDETETSDETYGTVHRDSAIKRGKESLRLGYTISQVVHGYGALCQAVTEYASEHSSEPIDSREFNRLNFCLDIAIAEAVSEFTRGQQVNTARAEVLRLGNLAHEMRNALASAITAHRLIKEGLVGFGGSTNQILEQSLRRMKEIIDRSLTEVRLKGEPSVDRQKCRIVDLIGEVETTASIDADIKTIKLHINLSPDLMVLADGHLLISAISNVLQNAIKSTKSEGNVWIRAFAANGRVLIEIEDECGGLPEGKTEELFQPFSQIKRDGTRLGLGLSISRKAVELHDGYITARDLPGKGSIFTIDLPQLPVLSGKTVEIQVH